jgi:hypothetical protein
MADTIRAIANQMVSGTGFALATAVVMMAGVYGLRALKMRC